MQPGMSASYVAQRAGVAPCLLRPLLLFACGPVRTDHRAHAARLPMLFARRKPDYVSRSAASSISKITASPTTAMTHIAAQEALDGKVVDWMEHVSEAGRDQ